ncbi:MAG: hypothetical protein ACTSXZ_11605 [Alphaproteobacteria bacterium]
MSNAILDTLRSFFDSASDNATAMTEALMVIEPVSPFGGRGMITVLVTTAGLISVALLGSLGLVSMMVLLVCLGLIFLILSKVFGIDFEVDPSDIFGFQPGPY